jgi:hypothetical protein
MFAHFCPKAARPSVDMSRDVQAKPLFLSHPIAAKRKIDGGWDGGYKKNTHKSIN